MIQEMLPQCFASFQFLIMHCWHCPHYCWLHSFCCCCRCCCFFVAAAVFLFLLLVVGFCCRCCLLLAVACCYWCCWALSPSHFRWSPFAVWLVSRPPESFGCRRCPRTRRGHPHTRRPKSLTAAVEFEPGNGKSLVVKLWVSIMVVGQAGNHDLRGI